MLPVNHTVESVARERAMDPTMLLAAATEIGIPKESVADTLSDWERERLMGAETVKDFAKKLNIPPARLLSEFDEIGLPKASLDDYVSVDEQWQRTASQSVNVLAQAEDIPADSLLRKLEDLGRPKPSAQALLTAEEQEQLSSFVRAQHLSSTIRAMRDYRGLTQTELAAAVGISDRQLAKIEAGEVDLLQADLPAAGEGVPDRQLAKIEAGEVDYGPHFLPDEDPTGLREKLAGALQVELKDLFGKTDIAAQIRDAESQRQHSVAVRALVTPEARSAFSRIRDRYGWTVTQVMELAPLMFILLAEGSLTRRRRRLDELQNALGGAPGGLHRVLMEFHSEIHERVEREQDSIRECNLRQDCLFRAGFPDPFSAYLFDLAATLEKADVPPANKSPNGEQLLLRWLLRDEVLRCPSCHERIQPDHSHCPWCGKRTDHEEPSEDLQRAPTSDEMRGQA